MVMKVSVADVGHPSIEPKEKFYKYSLLDFKANHNEMIPSEDGSDEIRAFLKQLKDVHLRKITEFYRKRLENTIQDIVIEVLASFSCDCSEHEAWEMLCEDDIHFLAESALASTFVNINATKCCLQEVEQLVTDGHCAEASRVLLDMVMKRGALTARKMWECFVKNGDTKPNLKKILDEILHKDILYCYTVGNWPLWKTANAWVTCRKVRQSAGSGLISEAGWRHETWNVPDYALEIHEHHKQSIIEQIQKATENYNIGILFTEDYIPPIIVTSNLNQNLVKSRVMLNGAQLETLQTNIIKTELETIEIHQFFGTSFGKSSRSGNVIVVGATGMGKTSLVQKIIYDWATGKMYPQFHFVFHFRFRELNNIQGKINLKSMILSSYPYLSHVVDNILQETYSILFLFDGLDECKAVIDFTDTRYHCSHHEDFCEVTDIVRCLIKQKLLKGCSVLLTSRQMSLESLKETEDNLFVEILGFSGFGRSEYFLRFFIDKDMAEKAFKYVEENDILYTMCQNPFYCKILCPNLRIFFTQNESQQGSLPQTITQLYKNYIYNILKHRVFVQGNYREQLFRTGQLAFMGICNNIFLFTANDFSRFGLKYSQFQSAFMNEHLGVDNSATTYSFVHHTIQQFIAALATHLAPCPQDIIQHLIKYRGDGNERFQIFLGFVIGLSSSDGATNFEEIVGSFCSQTVDKVREWVRERTEADNQEITIIERKSELLKSCYHVFELQNTEIMQNIMGTQRKLTFGHLTKENLIQLTPIDCIVLAAVLDTCDVIEELDFNHCEIKNEGIEKMTAVLHKCKLLNLDNNKLLDSGVKRVSAVLSNSECKIQKLRLSWNSLTAACIEDLASALRKNDSLEELDLNDNKLGDSGGKQLCAALSDTKSNIGSLGLHSNSLTDGCTDDLVSALSTSRSLKELDLGSNSFTDSSVHALHCLIETCTSLEMIWLDLNQFGSEGKRQLKSLQNLRAGLKVIAP